MTTYIATAQKSSLTGEGDSRLTSANTFAPHGGLTIISNGLQDSSGFGQSGRDRLAPTQVDRAPDRDRATPDMSSNRVTNGGGHI